MPSNLLFITSDQQRWDSLPCYGLDFIQTPALDRIAAEGMAFETCIVPAPLCVPCRSAMLSGQYASTTGVMGNGHGLPDGLPSWPAVLGEAGHRTAAIGKMHFNPWDDMGGFQERIIAEDKRHFYLPDDPVKFLQSHGMERVHPTEKPEYFETLQASVTPREKRFHIDGFVGDRAADWLEANGREPFAAWVSFPGPHDPYDPPEEMARLYYDAPIPEPIGSPEELEQKPPAQRKARASRQSSSVYQIDLSQATPEHYRFWRAHYSANITLIDEGIGKMLAALEAVGALDDTLIVFTSDHGDALGDHGLAYKSFFYEPIVRVPLLMRGPGVPTGQRSGSLVSTIDLVPLFYRACGVSPPDTLQSEDISALLSDPSATIRDAAFSENLGRAMVRTTCHKYAHYVDGSCELYDLEADPNELSNLAGDPAYHEVQAALHARLTEHWLANVQCHARLMQRPQNPIRARLEEEYRKGLERGG